MKGPLTALHKRRSLGAQSDEFVAPAAAFGQSGTEAERVGLRQHEGPGLWVAHPIGGLGEEAGERGLVTRCSRDGEARLEIGFHPPSGVSNRVAIQR